MVNLLSACGLDYDPVPTLNRLKNADPSALDELWENLYHQGDVGTASYFAVPALVQLKGLDLVASIEVARHLEGNPALPPELQESYKSALSEAISEVPEKESSFQSFYVIHASIHGQRKLAQALNLVSTEEILNEYV